MLDDVGFVFSTRFGYETTRRMLTAMQERFAVEYVGRMGDGTSAALAAGYAESTAHTMVSRLLSSPFVAARIVAEVERQRAISGTIGLMTMQKIAKGDNYPAAARVTAARALMDYARLFDRADSSAKDPADMSADELRDLIGRIERELSERAKPVNAPVPALIDDQVSDFL